MSFGFSVSVFRFSVSVSVSHTFRFSVSVFILVTLLVRLIGFRFRFSVFFVNFFEISQKNVKILISFGFYYSFSVSVFILFSFRFSVISVFGLVLNRITVCPPLHTEAANTQYSFSNFGGSCFILCKIKQEPPKIFLQNQKCRPYNHRKIFPFGVKKYSIL